MIYFGRRVNKPPFLGVMECAILKYGVGSVDLVTVPDDIDDVEVYLYDVLGYREDEIEFMIKESKINIIDDRT